jgi:hypothetical protein
VKGSGRAVGRRRGRLHRSRTTDHNQNGYFLESYERLIYGWTFRMDEDGAFVVAYPQSQYPGLVIPGVTKN